MCCIITFYRSILTTLKIKRHRPFPLTNSSLPIAFPPSLLVVIVVSRFIREPRSIASSPSSSNFIPLVPRPVNPTRLSGTSEKPDGLNYRRFSLRLFCRLLRTSTLSLKYLLPLLMLFLRISISFPHYDNYIFFSYILVSFYTYCFQIYTG